MWKRYIEWRREQPPVDYWLLIPQTIFIMLSLLVFTPYWYVGIFFFLLFAAWQNILLPVIRTLLRGRVK